MGWKLAFSTGGFLATWFAFIPVSKTYYSDHVYTKYIPRIMFVGDRIKEEEYLKIVDHVRRDCYLRELYGRNYHCWMLRKPICTVIDYPNSEPRVTPLISEDNTK